jgi:hypothetical protein
MEFSAGPAFEVSLDSTLVLSMRLALSTCQGGQAGSLYQDSLTSQRDQTRCCQGIVEQGPLVLAGVMLLLVEEGW